MEQKLPYEQQLSEQWINLPLPNEDTCWADMKKRLEEEDDDRPIIFWWRRGCAVWGLLLLALLSIGWWGYLQYSPKAVKSSSDNSTQQSKVDKSLSPESGENRIEPITEEANSVQDESLHPTKSNIDSGRRENRDTIASSEKSIQQPVKQPEIHLSIKEKKSKDLIRKQIEKQGSVGSRTDKVSGIAKEPKLQQSTEINTKEVDQQGVIDQQSNNVLSTKVDVNDTISSKFKDTVSIAKSIKKDNLPDPEKNPPKKDSANKSSFFFSGGLSLHQQIPTAGQSFTPYNSLGRKGSLADYIPAPYIRFTKKDKWFVQAEFRYGAPVYTGSFVYNQNATVDTLNNRVLTNSLKLKKTFYHQLPVSFHYYIRPGFTIGTGFVWNKFKGAIAEQELISRNRTTGIETLLNKAIIKDSSGQSFGKSFFQAHVEAQYQWKKLQLGARYNFGVQPFIKFTLPGLAEQSRKSNSLQVFFRYQLWRSKSSK